MEASLLRDLPGELRNKIYGFVFSDADLEVAKHDVRSNANGGRDADVATNTSATGNTVTLRIHLDKLSSHNFGIFGTCKAIRNECLSFIMPSDLRVFVTFPANGGSHDMRNLSVDLTTWRYHVLNFLLMFSNEEIMELTQLESYTMREDCGELEYLNFTRDSHDDFLPSHTEYRAFARHYRLYGEICLYTNFSANSVTGCSIRLRGRDLKRTFFRPATQDPYGGLHLTLGSPPSMDETEHLDLLLSSAEVYEISLSGEKNGRRRFSTHHSKYHPRRAGFEDRYATES